MTGFHVLKPYFSSGADMTESTIPICAVVIIKENKDLDHFHTLSHGLKVKATGQWWAGWTPVRMRQIYGNG
ncbi:hypothetical protein SKAU_G00026190 [Synaphobranchus kaupii]|uniref:Uncharacterized protein n=1 Tax=Synaphobranchus kaupii TaxID=118154 RepID=A0A9Q1GCR1_SYNKA|nr:hypothetical protein SKAU_G00026190 [Synaphobranchus kaupii]